MINLIQYAILADVVLSLVMQGRENNITRMLRSFTRPILVPARNLQERIKPGLPVDLSPLIVLFVLNFLYKFLVPLF